MLRENEALRRGSGLKFEDESSGALDGKYRWTPKASHRRAWEELEERESTRATYRNRSSGQRSGGSSVRNVRYSDGEDSLETGNIQPRRISDNSGSVRKSSNGHSVAFEASEEVISVPVSGSMRPSRSRVSTPFFSEEAVNRMTQKAPTPSSRQQQTTTTADSSDDSGGDRHSSVNFEKDVHVVEVPLGDEGHHSRSVRGRIATPFIRDIPTREAPGAENPEEVTATLTTPA